MNNDIALQAIHFGREDRLKITMVYSCRKQWWTLFEDPLLNSLITRAGTANFDIRIAEARLLPARAEYRMATGEDNPSISVSGAYANIRRSENIGSSSRTHQDLFQIGFDAGWDNKNISLLADSKS